MRVVLVELSVRRPTDLGAFESAGTAEVLAEDELVAADAVLGVLASVEELLRRLTSGLLSQLRHGHLVHQPTQLVLVRLPLQKNRSMQSINQSINIRLRPRSSAAPWWARLSILHGRRFISLWQCLLAA